MQPTESPTIDVETVNPQALAIRPQMEVARPMDVKEIIAQVKLIQEVMRSVMTEGAHYGTIPGCGDRKTLLQPGAQKLTMTFRLAPEYQIQETDLDRGHKEYRVTCTLKSIQSGNFVGQGVGCCSSMESKYRYRGGSRKCPKCGKETIIMGKQFKPNGPPPGWLCWAKKGGCGATWPKGAAEIEAQSIEKVENENPADTFNTVLKMAKKRAFVDATITATAASDIFTQDIGDDENPESGSSSPPPKGSQTPPGPSTPPSRHTPPAQSAGKAPAANAPAPKPATAPIYATPETRFRMADRLGDCKKLAEEFCRKLENPAWLMPNEGLVDLPLEYVPVTTKQFTLLQAAIADFGNGDPAVHPYPANPLAPVEKAKRKAKAAPAPTPKPKASEAPELKRYLPPAAKAAAKRDPEWWRDVICPIPPRGVKRDEWMKAPQTVGQMYDNRHDKETATRLFGFIGNFEVKTTWEGGDGKVNQRNSAQIASDGLFRDALDACKEFADKHHGDTEAKPEPDAFPDNPDDHGDDSVLF